MRGDEQTEGSAGGIDDAGAERSGFVWSDERLEAAGDEELREHVADLQERMEAYEARLEDVRETLAFLLDAQAGFVDPEVATAALEETDRE
jgi:hypothetical protein